MNDNRIIARVDLRDLSGNDQSECPNWQLFVFGAYGRFQTHVCGYVHIYAALLDPVFSGPAFILSGGANVT